MSGPHAVADRMPPSAHRKQILDHLIRMAGDPAWKAYAWHAAKNYEALNPFELSGIQEELKQHMQQQKGTA